MKSIIDILKSMFQIKQLENIPKFQGVLLMIVIFMNKTQNLLGIFQKVLIDQRFIENRVIK